MPRLLLSTVCLLVLVATITGASRVIGNPPAEPRVDGEQLFREKIEPVLRTQCYGCHSQSDGAKLEGGLRLDASNTLDSGGDSGPAINREHPIESLLLQAIRHEGGLQMPPDRPRLDDAVIEDFRKWLMMGAPDPRPSVQAHVESIDLAKARSHYAFQPLGLPPLPSQNYLEQAFQAIDRWLLTALADRQRGFAEEASRSQWLRRVYLDVIGLPPSIEAVTEFDSDDRPDAYERVVDRLLASPQYGPRWAQHWLDVVRYAESEGYEYDRHVPDAWRYRDYVIDSLNADKPFDQFVTEQLAGDELDPANAEMLSAAIFHRLGPVRRNAGNPDIALSRNEVLTERTDILGSAVLGMTIGCARCHNHKLEPFTQRDYYQLQAYLAATEEHNVSLAPSDEQAAWDARTKGIKDRIQALQKAAKSAVGAEKEKLSQQIQELDETLPEPLPTIPSIRNDWSKQTPIHILRRGVWELKGAAVAPAPPAVLVSAPSAATAEVPQNQASAGLSLAEDCPNPRTQLARWMMSHPLTARVAVNRLWQHHFGRGLVATPNDLGIRSPLPSHPELLEYLAFRLVEHEWHWKPLHREMLLSRAYRQTDQTDDAWLGADPDNRWLGRFSRRRLSGEEIRDMMLVVSGQINLQNHGRSVMLPVDQDMVQLLYKPSQWIVDKDPAAHARRSIYLFAKRNLRLPVLENLDAPAMLNSCARRESSTHAPQALELMNGWQANQLAGAWGQRLQGLSHQQMIDAAFPAALGRQALPAERQLCLTFLQSHAASEFALAIFNLNEFVYVR